MSETKCRHCLKGLTQDGHCINPECLAPTNRGYVAASVDGALVSLYWSEPVAEYQALKQPPQGTTYAVALDAASPSYDPKVWVYENGGWLPETEKFYSFMFRIQLAVPKKEFSIESMSDDELKSLARQAGFRAGTISYMDGEGSFRSSSL